MALDPLKILRPLRTKRRIQSKIWLLSNRTNCGKYFPFKCSNQIKLQLLIPILISGTVRQDETLDCVKLWALLHIIIQHFTNIRIAHQSTWLIECVHQQMLKAKIKGHPWEKEMCSEKVDWPQETVTRIRATTALHVLDNFWLLSPFRLLRN